MIWATMMISLLAALFCPAPAALAAEAAPELTGVRQLAGAITGLKTKLAEPSAQLTCRALAAGGGELARSREAWARSHPDLIKGAARAARDTLAVAFMQLNMAINQALIDIERLQKKSCPPGRRGALPAKELGALTKRLKKAADFWGRYCRGLAQGYGPETIECRPDEVGR